MNNLVFNEVASQLKASIYAQAPDQSVQALQMDNTGQLLVAGSLTVSEITAPVTVSQITAPVTIGNASLTIDGTVEITNTSLTVDGTVEITNASLTVNGTVAVSQIADPVTIGNASLTIDGTVEITNTSITVAGTITVGGSSFVEDSVTAEVITGTGVIFDDTDISALKVASIFLYNEGATPITISLQISPTTTDGQYIDDPSYTDVVLGNLEMKYISVARFAHYIRLQYEMDASTGTISAYFNAQA